MKHRKTLVAFATVLLLGIANYVLASDEIEPAELAEEAELQAQLEVEYEKAMSTAKQQRLAAEASMEKAQEQLMLATEQRTLSAKQSVEARTAREAEMAKMHEELTHARRQLQETSREMALVNRELARASANRHTTSYVIRTSERPLIGVILGDANEKGVEILGVSPDGPSERAGIKQGDVITAVGGRSLNDIDETGDAGDALRIAMRDVEADKPLIISVERGDKTLDMTVVPEVREPLSWQSVTRFPTAPTAPRAPHVTKTIRSPHSPASPESVITIERIVVPDIDTVEMTAKIDQMRTEIEKRRVLRDSSMVAPTGDEWEIELHEMSELGHFALEDTNVWFGWPMAQGLQLAEIDPGLGEYFKTDRGVLVLKARTDNELQLKSGDVILQVGETEVNSPAEFMRALRGFESGDELVMDIKRKRKNRTLKATMPDDRTSFFLPGDVETHTFTITSSPH